MPNALRRVLHLLAAAALLLAPAAPAPAQVTPGQRAAVLSQSLDADTRAWQAAVIDNGGSVSQSWVRSVDQFVRGCKADGIWDSLLDVGLLCGADNLSGALVKLKTPSGVSRILVNNNFVSGDYTATGAAAGLLGNGTSKYLNIGTTPAQAGPSDSVAFGVYGSSLNAGAGSRGQIGAGGSSSVGLVSMDFAGASSAARALAQTTSFPATAATTFTSGFLVGSSTSNTDIRIFSNGAQSGATSTGSRAGSMSTVSMFVFAYSSNAVPVAYASSRLSFYFAGSGLSASQVTALSNRVNALMATIGASQY